MQAATSEGSAVRMAGYMEKRRKMKMMSSWKKYWFVLEGQLLLYYKSQLEYINLSACRGSLNIGLASCVRPGQNLTLQVVTRTQCVTLRTKERSLQEQWLQALLDSMALPNTSSLKRNSAGTQHFRYSLDNLPAISEVETEESLNRESMEKKSTLPRLTSSKDDVLSRIRRLGGVTYNTPLPHSPLIKCESTPTIPEAIDDNSPPVAQEQETAETPHVATSEIAAEDATPGYSEIIINETLKDENQNTSHIQEETNPSQMSENVHYMKQETVMKCGEVEEVEYCTYDKVALMKDVKNMEEYEPDLPPRPVANSIPEYEEVIMSQSTSDKKHFNLRDRIPLLNKSRSAKVLVKSASLELPDEGKKKKRKNSFLKFVSRLKKKESQGQGESVDMTEESEEEPVYETVNFIPHPEPDPQPDEPSEQQPVRHTLKYVNKQLSPSTIQELRDRMKVTAEEVDSDEESDDYDTIKLPLADDTSKEDPRENASTTCTDNSQTAQQSTDAIISTSEEPSLPKNPDHVYAEANKSKKLTLVLPSLPPRRQHRPTSPWHDVPTNNSPISANAPALEEKRESIPDDVLNTPLGFQMLKNKWQSVDKRGEWNREQQQVAFPEKSHSIENLAEDVRVELNEHESLKRNSVNEKVECDTSVMNGDAHEDETTNPMYYSVLFQPNATPALPVSEEKDTEMTKNEIYFTITKEMSDFNEMHNTQNELIKPVVETPPEDGDNFTNNKNFFAICAPESDVKQDECVTSDACVGQLVDITIDEASSGSLDTDDEIVGINRYSDELHLLLTQLAEITSAPLFQVGATKSLNAMSGSFSALDAELGPIRRRRHSDPDYDVPRSHRPVCEEATHEVSMSPDSLEPALEHFISDVC